MEDPSAGSTLSPSMASTTADVTNNIDKFASIESAWFKLVFGIVYMAFGFFCLVVFFRARDVFEIRARSVYLVTTLGLLLLLYQGILVDFHAIILFNTRRNFLTNNLLVFFVTFAIAGCYISRVIRLAVGFSPQLRRSLPKLMSDKLLAGVSVGIGVASLAIPLYYKFTIPDEIEYRSHQKNAIWICSLALMILQFCLLPIFWSIDDLFHISREIMVIIVLGLIQSVLQKFYIDNSMAASITSVINPPNTQLVATSVLFGLSVVDPVRRLKLSPMARSSSVMARAAAKKLSAKTRKASAQSSSDHLRRGSRSSADSGGYSQQMWNYDKIAMSQPMAEAFRAFANRALCQESVWFLEEVSRFQNEDFTIASPLGGGEVEAFEAITKRFIADGAPDEVNLSYKDKKRILNMYNKGFETYDSTDGERSRSGVFDRAYSEIRFMIESNILHKFTDTEEFRKMANSLPSDPPKRRFFFLPC